MITLVALLAVTTGAWSQPWTSGDCTVTFSDGVLTVSGAGAMADYTSNSAPWYGYDIKTIVIESGVTSIGEGAFASCYNLESVSIPASVTSIGARAFEYCGLATTAPTVSFAEGSTPLTIGERAFYYANLKSIDIPNRVTSIGEQAFSGCSSMESVSIPASVTSIREEAFWNCGMLAKVYIFAPSLTTYGDLAFDDNADGRKIYVLSDAVDTYKAGWPAYAADIVGDLQPLASGPKVTWTAASKTGTFTMPGGNVTLEPEYYPQATAAEGAVTAATDAKATTDAPLVTIDETKLTGAKKLMYYVSTDDTAPAYDADGWTDQLPTAEGFTQQGIVYIWYYPVGTDEGDDEATATYSDGDICATALTVSLGAAPTYAVTFADDLTEPDKWTASPAADVKKGQTVTVTYNGSKKVIGVKAEKKAAPAETTVTLTPGEIGDLTSGSNSKTINGITIEVSGDANFHSGNGVMEVSASDPDTGEPVPTTGTFTFTSSVGNIKRIDINHNGGNWWGSGDGWPGSYEVYHSSTFTWSGTPAASVTLNGSGNDMDNCTFVVSSFVFTIEPTN